LQSNLPDMKDADLKKILVALAGLSTLLLLLVVAAIFSLVFIYYPTSWVPLQSAEDRKESKKISEEEIRDGMHVATGFVEGEGLQLVIANCTNCHSAKLVTQNRFTKEGWTNVIRWMQETQGLWDLGNNEEVIVAYLARYYAPEPRGRRKPLEVEWYELE